MINGKHCMMGIPKGPGYLDQYSPETLFDATFAAPLKDFWIKPSAYQLQYSEADKRENLINQMK